MNFNCRDCPPVRAESGHQLLEAAGRSGGDHLLRLLARRGNKTVRDIMRPRFVSVAEDTDQETVAAIPVVDAERRVVGELRLRDWWRVIRKELFGTTAGSMLPFALRRLGLDPASASAP